jgi:benzodiazapine receptor
MTELASPRQLRAAFLRWCLVLIPGILLLGFLSGAAAGSGPRNVWFAALTKPPLYPPPVTFAYAWSALYVLMGLALTLVVSSPGARWRRLAIVAFALQLTLNLAWSPLFFAAHRIMAGLILLGVLDVAVAACIVLFALVRPVRHAAQLAIPDA